MVNVILIMLNNVLTLCGANDAPCILFWQFEITNIYIYIVGRKEC